MIPIFSWLSAPIAPPEVKTERPVPSAYFTHAPGCPWTLPDLWTRRRAHEVV